MPLYELVMIAKSKIRRGVISDGGLEAEKNKLRQLLSFCAKHVLDNNGVVRLFTSTGARELPYRMRRHQEIHNEGSILTINFDSSPKTMMRLSKALSLNETVIRHTILNHGHTLSKISPFIDPRTK